MYKDTGFDPLPCDNQKTVKPWTPPASTIKKVTDCLLQGKISSTDIIKKSGYSMTTVFKIMAALEKKNEVIRHKGKGLGGKTYFEKAA